MQDINFIDDQSMYPLMYATQGNSLEVVKILISLNARITIGVLETARDKDNNEIIRLLEAEEKPKEKYIRINFTLNEFTMYEYLHDSEKTKVLVGHLDAFGSRHLALAREVNHTAYHLLGQSENFILHQSMTMPLIGKIRFQWARQLEVDVF